MERRAAAAGRGPECRVCEGVFQFEPRAEAGGLGAEVYASGGRECDLCGAGSERPARGGCSGDVVFQWRGEYDGESDGFWGQEESGGGGRGGGWGFGAGGGCAAGGGVLGGTRVRVGRRRRG